MKIANPPKPRGPYRDKVTGEARNDYTLSTKDRYKIPMTPEERLDYQACTKLKRNKSRAVRVSTVDGRAKELCEGARHRALRAGSPFDIDETWIAEKIRKGFCEKTGVPFYLGSPQNGDRTCSDSPSLDQIIPGKGYCKDNVQVVSWQYNRCKGIYTDAELLEFAYLLIRRQLDSEKRQ